MSGGWSKLEFGYEQRELGSGIASKPKSGH